MYTHFHTENETEIGRDWDEMSSRKRARAHKEKSGR